MQTDQISRCSDLASAALRVRILLVNSLQEHPALVQAVGSKLIAALAQLMQKRF